MNKPPDGANIKHTYQVEEQSPMLNRQSTQLNTLTRPSSILRPNGQHSNISHPITIHTQTPPQQLQHLPSQIFIEQPSEIPSNSERQNIIMTPQNNIYARVMQYNNDTTDHAPMSGLLTPSNNSGSVTNTPNISYRFREGAPDLDDNSTRKRMINNFNAGSYTPDEILRKIPERKGLSYSDGWKTRSIHNTTINENNMEKKLNELRRKFDKRHRQDSQLGLTNIKPGPIIITPLNESINEELQLDDVRQELGFRRDTFWKGCGERVIDKRSMQYFVHVFIGLSVMVFCMAKIWSSRPRDCDGDDVTVYISLLSALVGFYIPSPSMNRQNTGRD